MLTTANTTFDNAVNKFRTDCEDETKDKIESKIYLLKDDVLYFALSCGFFSRGFEGNESRCGGHRQKCDGDLLHLQIQDSAKYDAEWQEK